MKTETIPHPEDVLEHTLTFGYESAMKRFSISREQVKSIVQPFIDEVDAVHIKPCSCEIDWKNGYASMCWQCNKKYTRR